MEVRRDEESSDIQHTIIRTRTQGHDHRECRGWLGRFTEEDTGRVGMGEGVQSPRWEMPAGTGAESVGFKRTKWESVGSEAMV